MSLPKTPSFRLDSKRALITGASSGIGLGCAVALAQAGSAVTLAARSVKKLEETVNKLHNLGLSANALEMDVRDIEATQKVVASHGPFDILVNSAGTAAHSLAINTTEQDYDAVVDLNIKGAYFLTTAVAKGLIQEGKPGSLINISSQMAHVGGIERAVY